MTDKKNTNQKKKPLFVPTMGNLKEVEKNFEKAREEIKNKKDFKREDFKSV